MRLRQHPRTHTRSLVAAFAVLLAFGMSFAMYGSSGTAVAKERATVSIGKVKGVGHVLVDAKGHTLYTLVDDHQSVECTGACLEMGFVPLTVDPGTKPTAGKGVKGLSLVAGTNQVAENGFPLFLFSADKRHEAMGQGMESSGATWHAPTVKVAKHKDKDKKNDTNAGTGGVSF